MRSAFETDQKNRKREARVFSSFEEAIDASTNHPWFPKRRESAIAIVERHVLPVPDAPTKFTFIHDVRTYGQKQMVHATLDMMLQ